MSELVHVTARIEASTRDALKAMAKARMMQIGEAVTLADMIREGLAQFVSTAQPVGIQERKKEENLDLFEPEAKPKRRKANDPETLVKAQAAELIAEGMSQRDVAAALTISQSKVSKLLKG